MSGIRRPTQTASVLRIRRCRTTPSAPYGCLLEGWAANVSTCERREDGQGDDNVTPDEFAHLFRPDAGSPSPAPAHPNPSPPNPSPPNPSPDAEADPPLPVSAPSEAASGQEASGEETPQAPAADEPLEASSTPARPRRQPPVPKPRRTGA